MHNMMLLRDSTKVGESTTLPLSGRVNANDFTGMIECTNRLFRQQRRGQSPTGTHSTCLIPTALILKVA